MDNQYLRRTRSGQYVPQHGMNAWLWVKHNVLRIDEAENYGAAAALVRAAILRVGRWLRLP